MNPGPCLLAWGLTAAPENGIFLTTAPFERINCTVLIMCLDILSPLHLLGSGQSKCKWLWKIIVLPFCSALVLAPWGVGGGAEDKIR